MTSSENKVGLKSPALDLHQWLASRLSPAHTTTFTVLRLWPAMHRNVTSATLLQVPRHSFTAGILQVPKTTQGCRVKVSYCNPLPSQQPQLPHSAFHLLPSLLSVIFPCKYHFQTFSSTNPQRLLAFLSPFRPICVVTFHKRASSIPPTRSKQTATKHTTLAHLSLHTPFSLLKSSGFPSPFSCWNTVSS